MNPKTFNSSRRGFLRGVGVTMALPFLESLSPAGKVLAQGKQTGALGANGEPIRFATFFMPNGVNPRAWMPNKGGGKIGELPRILKPLDALREHINVITGIKNPGNGHSLGTASFLTGMNPHRTMKPSEVNVHNASLDQIIGEALKTSTVFPTLELGIGGQAQAANAMAATPVYTSHICWKDAKTPIPYEVNPQRAFDRLFKNATAKGRRHAKAEPSNMPDSSVIDAVLADAKALGKKLGREDKAKLDEYFTAVREVEKRIAQQNAVTGLNITEDVLKDILGLKGDIREHMADQKDGRFQKQPKIPQREYGRLMMDILALSFWSNSTRSATLSFGNGFQGGGNMSFLDGVNSAHHQASHHGFKDQKLEQFTVINTFYMEQYAYLLDRLKNMQEGSSNVLENSLVLFGSNISTGQAHNGKNIPVILSGNAGGRLKTGRHIATKNQPIGDLHRSILDMMNVEAKIGKGSATIKGI
ncbi:DUF1552 domain-containing protein [Verrucomicrobiaceae bacterium 5K15]|uniref:DUF1552 domain-containing protein n=1 Tax=Oceaniferula flava TaxID=2800421 RepID=A0AAE2SFD2_9BACT|nr:DUF1552 domain-containing protein [Oceaniferula flavus]MBK1855321.1 DUF1552 domain-containing protein [Oceaniferula flavus]MBM1136627.1 DUF1552 domain-containing protein [Oceaniferula flavus]